MLKHRNLVIMLGLDSICILASLYLSYFFRYEFTIPSWELAAIRSIAPWVLVIKLAIFWFFGLYKGMWRYTGLPDLLKVLRTVALSSLVVVAALLMVHGFRGYPRSVFAIDAMLTFLLVSGLRVAIRLFLTEHGALQLIQTLQRPFSDKFRKILIIGAGDAADRVIREIRANLRLKLNPIGILDDNTTKWGKAIHGVPVLGQIKELAKLPMDYDEIIIAIPSARGEVMRRIVTLCERTGKPFRTVPNIGELIDGKVSVKAARNVRVEDLLGREELHLDEDEIARYLSRKRILVTGAGGSIGSELARQIGKFTPQAVCLFEISELNLFRVEMEFKQRFPFIKIETALGDIRDGMTVERVFKSFKPHVVFHAAAYKHVPMQEQFPWEAVHNNVLGSLNLVQASRDHGVDRFVLVSTDKAVRPTNVMGATKRVAEMFVECVNSDSRTSFMAVRFGNVMGSSGSAVPVFREQIARGGPVTVTHPDVTRYFMSVGEAAQLILQAGALGRGGEIFILEMGEPVRILDLVKDMIRLHGFEPETEIPIHFIGLRPGEKLYEELITEGEGIMATGHNKIMVLKGNACSYDDLMPKINGLLDTAQTYDEEAIKMKLHELVPEYKPSLDAGAGKMTRTTGYSVPKEEKTSDAYSDEDSSITRH